MDSKVNHPAHYGGKDNPYEAIKVIEAWGLGFNLGNCIKYISRAGKKGSRKEDLEKAKWYLDREIQNAEKVRAPCPNIERKSARKSIQEALSNDHERSD